jgi:hypothetical protein
MASGSVKQQADVPRHPQRRFPCQMMNTHGQFSWNVPFRSNLPRVTRNAQRFSLPMVNIPTSRRRSG